MATEWKGWKGAKRWESIGGDCSLEALHDGLGHISTRVSPRRHVAPEWIAEGVLTLEAGTLDQIAREVALMERWATFDCYGTLIDWDSGIRAELVRMFGPEAAPTLLARYHEIEPRVQAEDPALPYRDVLRLTLARLGDVPAGDEDALGRSLPSWPVFPEVPAALDEARGRGWKLAILSNTDREFIEASKQQIGVPFDETVVASEIGSYKPAHRHWDEFSVRTNADPERHVHVAASLFHDIAPARELGLTSVWINRLGEQADPEPTRELTDLSALPDTLDALVPR